MYSLLRQRGRSLQALKLVETANDFPPSERVRREAQGLVARHEAEIGEPSRAMKLIAALPEEDRASVELQLVRVRLLLKLQKVDEAVAELERLQRREPGRADIGFELAAVLSSIGRPQASLEVLSRLEPFVTGSSARSALFQRKAGVWQTQERWARAIEALQTASRLEPTRADLHYRIAELFERMGSSHSAVEALRRGRLLDTPEGVKATEPWMDRLRTSAPVESR